MSMRPSSRRELFKLRELVHFLLVGEVCCFCNKPLSQTAEKFSTHGNSVGPKLDEQITVHHRNEDHEDNRQENKALCHTKCHKSWHRSLENRLKALRVQGESDV